jgi:Uma2 family endonuclease
MPTAAQPPAHYSVAQYFALADAGLLTPDERVELIAGMIVAMSPQSPRHASCVYRLTQALRKVLPPETVVRTQMPFIAGVNSVPEPDVSVVAGAIDDYDRVHPTSALLVVEVAETTVAQDRLTKSRIYAAAGVSEYWVVNLRADVVEWSRDLDCGLRTYRRAGACARGARIPILAFPGVTIEIDSILPPRDLPSATGAAGAPSRLDRRRVRHSTLPAISARVGRRFRSIRFAGSGGRRGRHAGRQTDRDDGARAQVFGRRVVADDALGRDAGILGELRAHGGGAVAGERLELCVRNRLLGNRLLEPLAVLFGHVRLLPLGPLLEDV